MSNNKEKGNAYERKIAKDLSNWMFNDPYLLRRKADSGSTKYNYAGDVFPEGQLPHSWNNHFPFIIETKTGYKRNYPDFWSYRTVSNWMVKAQNEGEANKQNIVFLITQFKNRTAFFITNQLLDLSQICFNICFPYKLDEDLNWGFVYFFNEIIKLPFNDLFNIQNLTN